VSVGERREGSPHHLILEEVRRLAPRDSDHKVLPNPEVLRLPGHLVASAEQPVVLPETARSRVFDVDWVCASMSRMRSKQRPTGAWMKVSR
jgi:hypothetical protein